MEDEGRGLNTVLRSGTEYEGWVELEEASIKIRSVCVSDRRNPESGRSGEGRILSFLKVVIWTMLVTASSFRSRPKGLIHTKTES